MAKYTLEYFEEVNDKKFGKVAGKRRIIEVECDDPNFADVEAMKKGAKIFRTAKPAYLSKSKNNNEGIK